MSAKFTEFAACRLALNLGKCERECVLGEGGVARANGVRRVEWKRKQKFLWHLFFNPCVWRQHAATFCLFISRYAYAACVPVSVCVCVRRNMRTWKTLSIVMKMTAQLLG